MHYLSGAYEHSMHLPHVGSIEIFKQRLLSKFHRLYDRLGSDYILPPDLVLIFDDADKATQLKFEHYIRSIKTDSSGG